MPTGKPPGRVAETIIDLAVPIEIDDEHRRRHRRGLGELSLTQGAPVADGMKSRVIIDKKRLGKIADKSRTIRK
jgi:hypothetical protein